MAILGSNLDFPMLSLEEKCAITSELQELVKSSQFVRSRRCQDFLEFVVQRALARDYDELTERSLGVALFNRAADYETAIDAIVRVRANDVRRRLAECYSGRSVPPKVRIEIAAGAYVPQFVWADGKSYEQQPESAIAPDFRGEFVDRESSGLGRRILSGARKPKTFLITVVSLIAIAVIGSVRHIWIQAHSSETEMLSFWRPVFNAKKPVTICFGDTVSNWLSNSLLSSIETHPSVVEIKPGDFIRHRRDDASSGNLRAAWSVSKLLDRYQIPTELRWPQEVQNEELERNSVIFIGAFSNPMTMSLNRSLHFTYLYSVDKSSGEASWSIQDQSVSGRRWSLTSTYPQPIVKDYSLITRIMDVAHNRTIISIGGLNQFGTEAAGEFLVDASAWREFGKNAPKGWNDKNLQIVLEMDVSAGRAIQPRIVASHVW